MLFLLKMRAKKQVKAIEQYREPNRCTFDEEGITVEYSDKTQKFPWEQIVKVVVAPKTIGFYYDADQALIVPKPDVGDCFVPIMTLAKQHVRPGGFMLR